MPWTFGAKQPVGSMGVVVEFDGAAWIPGVLATRLHGEYPLTFVESPNGIVLMANGIDQMMRWDGTSLTLDSAGLFGPTQPMRLSSWNPPDPEQTKTTLLLVVSNGWNVEGAGWARESLDYLNRRGFDVRYKKIPTGPWQSMSYLFRVQDIDNRFRSLIVDRENTLRRLTEILATKPLGYFTTIDLLPRATSYASIRASEGSGSGGSTYILPGTASRLNAGPIVGEYIAFQRWVDRYGNVSDPGPFARARFDTGVHSIVYEDVEAPTEPRVVRRQLWRTTAGQINQFYLDFETDDLQATRFVSDKVDTELELGETLAAYGDDLEALAWMYGVPPHTRRSLASRDGFYFAAGTVPYTRGCVQVTSGSTLVTGLNTEWIKTFEGRFFTTDDGVKAVEIVDVNVAAQTLVLVEPYAGPTAAFAKYAIMPAPGERDQLSFSAPGLIESWPYTQSVAMDMTGDRVTGVAHLRGYIYVLHERQLVKLTFSGTPMLGSLRSAARRGCISSRVVAEHGINAYFMDRRGIYYLDGREGVVEISEAIEDLFTGANKRFAINWEARDYFHAVKQSDVIRWFVSLGGEKLPRHALVWKDALQRWHIEEYPFPLPSSALLHVGENEIASVGSNVVNALSDGGVDVPAPAAARGPITAAGPYSFTTTANVRAVQPGMPVSIVEGRGRWQHNIVAEVAGDTVYVVRPWMVMPDISGPTQSVFQIGSVPWEWRGPMYTYAEDEKSVPRDIHVFWEPAEGIFGLRTYKHGSQDANKMGASYRASPVIAVQGEEEMQVELGFERGALKVSRDTWQERDTRRENTIQPELVGSTGPSGVAIYRMRFEGVIPKQRPADEDAR